ncbi:MAG: sulfatase-like hydrolase/transferase [Gammaproteobacteria bacterium]
MTHRASNKHSAVLAAIALWLVTLNDAIAEDSIAPNIVLIVADYMGYADIGPYGGTDVQTPSLESLARSGARFSNYYAASPVCGPSRAALLSGFYPARIGMERNVAADRGGLSASDSTLIRELKAAGYRTAMVGKWHLGRAHGYSPLSHGFDEFFGFHSWTLGYHDHRTSAGDPGLYRGEALVSEDGYLTEVFTSEATRFVAKNAGNPFFLYLAYNVALPPYQPPDLPESEWSSGWDANDATREDYVAMVEAMDSGIGKLLSQLDALSLLEDTLVIFTYDHGGRHLARSEPLFHGFGTLWEGGIRVPLLMMWRGQFVAGQTISRPTIAMDLTSTILAATGRDVDALQLDGSSLLPLLRNESDVAADTLFWRFDVQGDSMKAVRRDNWKYIVDRSTQMVFDLDSDPGERRNLFSERTDVANQLRKALRDWEDSFVSSE